MRKLLFCLFLLTTVFVSAQNDNCSEATSLNVGTSFNSSVVTSSNSGATTDGELPSCASDAVNNVWFTAVVPQSGKLVIETRKADNSAFDDSVLTVYSGTCGSLSQVDCNDDNYSDENSLSKIKLTGQSPGTVLYISVWKYNSGTNGGDFQISAYDPIPPVNDDCSQATPLTVGTDFNSNVATSTNREANTEGSQPSCSPEAIDNVWFTAVIPQSGKLRIETKNISSPYDPLVITAYTGSCDLLTEIGCTSSSNSSNPSILLTDQTPGATIYISVWKKEQFYENGEFKISAYDPIPPVNNECTQATQLIVGTDFNSNVITSTNAEATTDGSLPSCDSEAKDNVWFKVIVPPSGNLKIETNNAPDSTFYSQLVTVYSGDCNSLTEIGCIQDYSPSISLTSQTPGSTLYISVWRYNIYSYNGEFLISAYDDSILSTHEISKNKKGITAFPNPFHDTLTISDISNVKSIFITDTAGRMVKTIEKPTASLYLNDLKEGLYFVTLTMKDGSKKTIKAIKK